MAAFDFIMPADRMALVHFVRSLGGFDHGAEDPKALEALANQFRSKGFHIPIAFPSVSPARNVKEQPNVPALQLPSAEDKSLWPGCYASRSRIRRARRAQWRPL